ncbi:uncharacterized protein LAJ45_09021 [Morchella importuna]|uniref:uncharacterized protein n=1 Tax=Morchella importuna TaxID=1174673 RepID=UPI001E8CCEC8|nr:uncharacterized protein LAJ45_09021 [Morchella importuna]KAH8146941.1 hypothetical protein LAJ45_09021 [Morchella importuna]
MIKFQPMDGLRPRFSNYGFFLSRTMSWNEPLSCSIRFAEERKECSGRRGQLEAKNSVRGTVVRRKEALPHTHTPLGTKIEVASRL